MKKLLFGFLFLVGFVSFSQEIDKTQGFKQNNDKINASEFKNVDAKLFYRNKNAKQPLFILDGKEINKTDINKIDTKNIMSIYVLKGKSAKNKYGEKGKNGVVEIILKKK